MIADEPVPSFDLLDWAQINLMQTFKALDIKKMKSLFFIFTEDYVDNSIKYDLVFFNRPRKTFRYG